jgi:phosphotransferase system HPr (HPr) family protein
MNSIRYLVTNPWGLHARPSAFLAQVANTCAKRWEVVASCRGKEVDGKSIMGLMSLAAGHGSEIELFSLMPEEQWLQFTASLESLFYVIDQKGDKVNAYEPVERVITVISSNEMPTCVSIQALLTRRSDKYNFGPIIQRKQLVADCEAGGPTRTGRAPFSFESVDVFISYDSKDFSYAVRIYDALLDLGLNVFLAGASLPDIGTSDFQFAIEKALAATRSMVLVATEAEHLDGGWVRAEWTTFLNEKRAGRKSGNLVTVRPKTVLVTDLPVMLRMYQSEVIAHHGSSKEVEVDRLVKFLGVASET